MSTHDETGEPRRDLDEDPAGAVPEADSAEQHTGTADEDEREDWLERAAAHDPGEGSEGDIVEQAIETGGDDEDEHR